MKLCFPCSWCRRFRLVLGTVLAIVFATSFVLAQPQIPVVQLSTDTFTNPQSQHATEVEPDTYAFGSTIVTAFQVGRISGGGSSDIGFATSIDSGSTWTNGYLPGVTVNYQNGHFPAASDPSVTYDAAHGVWLIAMLGLSSNNSLLVSSSPDGINWNNPVTADNQSGFADKNWIACDNTATSPYFGHCYVTWDDATTGQILVRTSTNGGQTWGAAKAPPNAFGLGVQPVVRPNGKVVIAFWGDGMQAVSSNDGGSSWTSPVTISSESDHSVAAGLRSLPLPSAEVDGKGKIYVVWHDCRFRVACSANDIVMSTSKDGTTWSAVKRIPIDGLGSTKDHFIPGIGADPATKGATAHLALTYYFYPVANCTISTCKLKVGFTFSHDGGATWSKGKVLSPAMLVSWLPDTSLGFMVGDYISTSYVDGKAFGVFAIAHTPSGGLLDEAMYTPVAGLSVPKNVPYFSSAGEEPIPGARSDHGPRRHDTLELRRTRPSKP